MTRGPRRPLGAPIWIQILALLIGGLAAAQLVTLGLTILLPPEPPQRHSLQDIALALRGGTPAAADARPLIRTLTPTPPSLQSPGWAVSPPATRALAGLLAVPETDVRLLFYAPPPLAGTAPPPPRGLPPPAPHAASDADPRPVRLAGFIVLAQAGPPGGMPRAGRMGFPGGGPGFPGGSGFPSGRGGLDAPGPRATPTGDRPPSRMVPSPGVDVQRPSATPFPRSPASAGPAAGERPVAADRPTPGAAEAPRPPTTGAQGRVTTGRDVPFPGLPRGPIAAPAGRFDGPLFFPSREAPGPPAEAPPQEEARPPAPRASAGPEPAPLPEVAPRQALAIAPAAAVSAPPRQPPAALAPAATPAVVAAAVAPPEIEEPVGAPLPAPESARGLFGFASAPYVTGEFVAALRQADGHWVTVRPRPEGFPNSWQRRVLLWFVLSLALVGPLGYLMARRLAAPLHRFAEAAEQLGRDPSADLDPLDGPAEVGRAAEAFNQMQRRLKRYVEDRTSMVGAISHDLRTPLARMRFKLERASPALRAALDRDIAQMEEMITSVLSFMRDEAATGERRRIDLRSVLECAVDEAAGPAVLLDGASVEVEADPLGLQRVFDNLIGNALKYGQSAEVSLRVVEDEAVVLVADDGPGMTDAELAQAFKPFHRGDGAKASGKAGMGLGLTVSRSAIRAHGGDLTLRNGPKGLVAEVRLPLSRQASLAA